MRKPCLLDLLMRMLAILLRAYPNTEHSLTGTPHAILRTGFLELHGD
jgi:hypothetical protein